METDLEFYNGPSWRSMLSPITPAQLNYAKALQTCQPELLIAHAYLRYLGDLSGGQVFARKLRKYNELPEGEGVAFYQFDRIEDRDMYIVKESCRAFAMTIDLFREFDNEIEGSISMPVPMSTASTTDGTSAPKCPYANSGIKTTCQRCHQVSQRIKDNYDQRQLCCIQRQLCSNQLHQELPCDNDCIHSMGPTIGA
jgi:hypothetical protein